MLELELIGLDTETGGIYPAINPLLSIALIPSWNAPETTIYVLPEPGKIIDAEAGAINGYTPELWAERGAVPLHRALLMLGLSLQALLAEKKEARLVAHNAGFDRSFLEEATRNYQELPGRYQWECSMMEMGSLINDGVIPPGPRSLARLGELAGLWPVGNRPAVHDVTEDARATLAGYRWLRKQRKHAFAALSGLMPYVLEDYYPNCATPEYRAAVEAAAAVTGVQLPSTPREELAA
jgi:DNA polymerase III epsilon subunit-like protein